MNKKQFLRYVAEFYGPKGIYDMNAKEKQIREATNQLINSGQDVAFDSIDREKVRDILIKKFNLAWIR